MKSTNLLCNIPMYFIHHIIPVYLTNSTFRLLFEVQQIIKCRCVATTVKHWKRFEIVCLPSPLLPLKTCIYRHVTAPQVFIYPELPALFLNCYLKQKKKHLHISGIDTYIEFYIIWSLIKCEICWLQILNLY